MKIGKLVVIGLLAFPFAEILAFAGVSDVIGWRLALLALIGTTATGFLILSRRSATYLRTLGDVVAGRAAPETLTRASPVVPMLAAVLLAIPGFLTDAAALALTIPAVRHWLVGLFEVSGFVVTTTSQGMDERVRVPIDPDDLDRGAPRRGPLGPDGARRTPGDRPILDLEPDEWRQLPEPSQDGPKTRPPRR